MTLDATVGGHNKTKRAGTAGRGRAEQKLWTAGHATPGIEINFSARRCTACIIVADSRTTVPIAPATSNASAYKGQGLGRTHRQHSDSN